MRREKVVTLQDGSTPLKFKIRQMPAMEAHDFITKALLAVAGSANGVAAITGAVNGGGVSGLLGLLGGVSFADVKELADALLACCSRVIDGGSEIACTRGDIDGYVSDVRTVFKLYGLAVEVNFPEFFGEKKTEAESASPTPMKVHSGRPQKGQA
ncbi:MAG: hypothetical protein LIP77_03555 [Planctomycetes bacterium]|nr:hypothetical protein [Planctomycetota bacterium]